MKRQRRTKIDIHGKAQRVIELLGEGMQAAAIAEILTSEGVRVSASAVSRWAKEHGAEADATAERLFSEHVERELPKDLVALEEIEARALEWSREDPTDRADRISTWARVKQALPELACEILDANGSDKEELRNAGITSVVKRILTWAVEDMKDKSDRRKDMKLAAYVIEIKLARRGVLESSGSKVVMKFHSNHQDGSPLRSPETPDKKGLRLAVGRSE